MTGEIGKIGLVEMEVRCCCQPQKLLGWLPVPGDVHDGQQMRFPFWRRLDAQSRSLTSLATPDVIVLSVARLGITDCHGEPVIQLALKSDETPLERLRLIPGFQEAPFQEAPTRA